MGGITLWQIVMIFIIIVFPILSVIATAIARKAGYSGWWAMTMLIPFANIVMIWVVAFSVWPKEKQNKEGLE